jgi:hypothetical protein
MTKKTEKALTFAYLITWINKHHNHRQYWKLCTSLIHNCKMRLAFSFPLSFYFPIAKVKLLTFHSSPGSAMFDQLQPEIAVATCGR